MSAVEVVLELLGMAHALTSFVDILTRTVHENAAVAGTDTLHIKVQWQWATYSAGMTSWWACSAVRMCQQWVSA